MGCEGVEVDWILLAENKVQWRALVNTDLTFEFIFVLCFLILWAVGSLRSTLFYGVT
jgi:hypothetical protein